MKNKLYALALLAVLASTSVTMFSAEYDCEDCGDIVMYEDDSCEGESCDEEVVVDIE